MRLRWSARRQLLYYAVAGVVVLVLAWGLYQYFFTAPATCQDGVQNQGERGVDCGGPCSMVCTQDTKPLVVLWSRAFEVGSSSTNSGQAGTYTAAAYVRSNNVSAGARAVPYSFQLFDSSNALIVERDGTIDIPPTQTLPIVETNINVGTRTVARTLFAFGGSPVWHTATTPALSITNEQLASDGSRLSAILVNNSLLAVSRVTVDAVLFDSSGTARAASKSIVDVPAKGSQAVVFTWPSGTPGIVRAEITMLPPF